MNLEIKELLQKLKSHEDFKGVTFYNKAPDGKYWSKIKFTYRGEEFHLTQNDRSAKGYFMLFSTTATHVKQRVLTMNANEFKQLSNFINALELYLK